VQIDGAQVRAFRLRWGVTQPQLAKWLSLRDRDGKPWRHGEATVSQQMVDQIERGIRPAPSRPRYLGEIENPSVAEMLGDMLAFSDEEVQYFLTELLPPSARGAYQPRRNS
jgi:hypothetical protein